MNAKGERENLNELSMSPGSAEEMSANSLAASRAQLLTRFALGMILIGGEQLSQRLHDVRSDIDAVPEVHIPESETYDDTALELLRYLAIGAVMRGERRLVQSIGDGFRRSARATGWLVGKLNRATSNPLARPFRRPVEARARRLEATLDSWVREGRIEERRSRLLATEAVEEIATTAVDTIAHSPELNRMVRDVVAGQGMGLVEVARDNARQATVIGDDAVERVIRSILRMAPRDRLAPSPLAGQPQTMYAPETQLQADDDDE